MVIEKNNAKAIGLDKIQWVGLLLGIICLIVAVLPIFSATGDAQYVALSSYMFGYAFWFTLTMGFLGLTLLHHTVRGAWGLSMLRLAEAGGGAVMLVVFGLLLAPILMNMNAIYPWMSAELMNSSEMMKNKLFYLNQSGFTMRLVVYFIIWIAMAAYLRASSLKQDETLDTNLASKRTTLAAPGIVVYALTITLATVDLFMSLDPSWMSQIWGFLFIVMGCLAAFAISNIIIMSNAHRDPYQSIINKGLTKDLGNWMFVFTCLWAYFSYSQYVIIYAGNLPEFNSFFLKRQESGWGGIGGLLMMCQFALPFVILLSPKVKATPKYLMIVGLWIIFFRVVDMYWTIMPFFRETLEFHISDLLAFVGLGGIWFGVFGHQLNIGRLLPVHDPRLKTAYEHA